MLSILPLFVLFISFSPSYAQVFIRQRPSVGRVIAGIVIGVLCLLLLIVGFLCMLRRRRRARAMMSGPGPSGQYSTPYAAGWSSPYQGHQSAPPPPPPPHPSAGGPGMMHHDFYGQSQQHGQEGQKYPLYPPPYVSDGNPAQNHSPLGAPPPAHTKGEDYFAGGFRQK